MIAEYKKRLHKIWKSQLNSRHKVDATNTLAISLLRYRFVTVKWTRRELRDLDVLTWKVLRRYQSHHLNERVYLPRSQGGGGFMICLLTLGAGGSEPGSLPHNHPRSNHGCGVQAPTACFKLSQFTSQELFNKPNVSTADCRLLQWFIPNH